MGSGGVGVKQRSAKCWSHFVVLLVVLCGGCVAPRVSHSHFDFAALPKVDNGPGSKLGDLIPAAIALQAMGKDAGSAALLQAASSSETNLATKFEAYEKVVVLCRMVFTAKEGAEFLGILQGHTDFFGGTTYADWPLEPIEVVNGYPFWIVSGYALAGAAQPASSYVSYCIANCDWNAFRYRELSAKDKRAALAKLLSSPKWKRPLDGNEEWFLSSQIVSTPLIQDKSR